MILIGSRAFDSLKPGALRRPLFSSDYDVIMSKSELTVMLDNFSDQGIDYTCQESKKFTGKYSLRTEDKVYEIDATENASNKKLESLKDNNWSTMQIDGMSFDIPTVELLYLTKRSHANFNIFFLKTVRDLVNMQSVLDTDLIMKEAFENESVRTYYTLRYEEAKERFGKRQDRINLNVPNEKFFMKSQHCRQLDHDNLHILVAENGTPAYLSCKKDLTLAKIEKDLFFALPPEKKIRLPIEESLVIGMEREYISKLESLDDRIEVDEQTIYRKGLVKLLQDLSKGWFQDYCLDNINTLWYHREPWYEKLHKEIANIKLQEF